MQDNLYTPYIIRSTAYVNNNDVSSRFDGVLEEDTSTFKPYIASNKLLTPMVKKNLIRESYEAQNDLFKSVYDNTISEAQLTDMLFTMIDNIEYIDVNDEISPDEVGRELLNRRDNLKLFTPLWELMKQDINNGKLSGVKLFIKTLLDKYDGKIHKIHDEFNGNYVAYALDKTDIFLNRSDTTRILTGVAYQMVLLHELTHAGLPNILQHPVHFLLYQSVLYAYAYMYGVFTLTDIMSIDITYGSPTYLISGVALGLRILYIISPRSDKEWREQLRLAIDQSNIYLCKKNDDEKAIDIIKSSYWQNLDTSK